MSDTNYVTQENFDRIQVELHRMKSVDRPAASAAIAEAREKGDLKENAEYDAAKEAQGLLEAKINNLEGIMATARIIDENTIDTSRVSILTKVTVTNLGTKKTDSFEIYRHYYKDGKMAELTDYCLNDVLLTEKLHQLVHKNGYLLYSDAFRSRQILITPPSFAAGISQNIDNQTLF